MLTFRRYPKEVEPGGKQAKVRRIKQEMQHHRNQEREVLREKREGKSIHCYRDTEEMRAEKLGPRV